MEDLAANNGLSVKTDLCEWTPVYLCGLVCFET